MAFNLEKEITDIAKNVAFIKDNAVFNEDFNKAIDKLDRHLSSIEHKVGDLQSQMVQMGDKVSQVKAGIEKTADILAEKEIITEPEKKLIYSVA